MTKNLESLLRQLQTLDLIVLELRNKNESPAYCLGVILVKAKQLSNEIKNEMLKEK